MLVGTSEMTLVLNLQWQPGRANHMWTLPTPPGLAECLRSTWRNLSYNVLKCKAMHLGEETPNTRKAQMAPIYLIE